MRAEQGDAWWLCVLGSNYEYGQNWPQSDEEAVKWYRLAAEQGDTKGLWCLGRMYRFGRGIPQSYDEAVRCYLSAAESGHIDRNYAATLSN